MPISHVIVLSLIQGLTEFLPISSSGHLILLPKLIGWADQGLDFDAVIHLGTLLAILVYFYKDIAHIVTGFFRREKWAWRMTGLILLSMIPAGLVGVFFKDAIENSTRSVILVAVDLLFWGIILIIAEYIAQRRQQSKEMAQLSFGQAFFIGCAQALALLPGTSRSGITITAGIFSHLGREQAVRFAFLMGVPVIFGAGLLSGIDLVRHPQAGLSVGLLAVAFIVSFLSGLFAVEVLMKLLFKKGFYFFGAYRILLAIFLLLITFA